MSDISDTSESSYLGNEVDLRIITDNFIFCLIENLKDRDGNEVWLAYDEKQLDALRNKSNLTKAQLIKRCKFIIKFSADLTKHLAQQTNEHQILETILERGEYRFLPKLYCAADAEECYTPYLHSITDIWEREAIPNKAFIVFPYIPSQTIALFSKSWTQTERIENTFALLPAIAAAFEELTQAQLVHRDISPNNLLIDTFNAVHIIDFAFALDLKSTGVIKQIGEGTAKYRSPEVMTRSPEVDARADQFSLACVFYFLITGKVPSYSPGENLKIEFEQHLPKELVPALIKAIAEQPEDRFHSHKAFLFDLDKGFIQYQQELSGILPIKICSDLWQNNKNRLSEIQVELNELIEPIAEHYSIVAQLSNANLLSHKDVITFIEAEKGHIAIAEYLTKIKKDINTAEQKISQLEIAIKEVKRGNSTRTLLTEPQPIKRSEYTELKNHAQQQVNLIPTLLSSAKSFISEELNKHVQWPNNKFDNAYTQLNNAITALTALKKELSSQKNNTQQLALITELTEYIAILQEWSPIKNQISESYQQVLKQQAILQQGLDYKLTSSFYGAGLIEDISTFIEKSQAKNTELLKLTSTVAAQQHQTKTSIEYWEITWKSGAKHYKSIVFFCVLLVGVCVYGYQQFSKEFQKVNQNENKPLIPELSKSTELTNTDIKGQTYTVGNTSFTMKPIPAGSFMMGCVSGKNCQPDEKPAHKVTLDAFHMMETEVTWSLYQQCIDARACKDNITDVGDYGWGKGKRPVIYVSYNDIAEDFIPWLNKQTANQANNAFSLPSEAQWEYAASAGTTTKYSWGDEIDCTRAQYDGGNHSDCYYINNKGDYRGTAAVKSFLPNPFGLYDMHGNVWEWTQDCWNSNYINVPTDGSAWLTGSCQRRVFRGGSFISGPNSLRSAGRNRDIHSNRGGDVGFRLVQSEK